MPPILTQGAVTSHRAFNRALPAFGEGDGLSVRQEPDDQPIFGPDIGLAR